MLALALTLQAHVAAAEDASLPGEVIVILAGSEGTIDPSLGNIKALKQPPFDSFKSLKVLSRSNITLKGSEAVTVELPNGRRMQIAVIERMPDGRAKVQVSINKPNQKDYLPKLQVVASPGEPFFVAGQKFQGGTLVIGVRVGGQPPAAK
jgi:hypothetical protein